MSNKIARYIDPNGCLRYCRPGAVRLMFPGHADPDRRLEDVLELKSVAEDALEEYGIDMLELLTWPGKVQQEYALIGHSNEFIHSESLRAVNEEAAAEDEDQSTDTEGEADRPTNTNAELTAYADGGTSTDADDDSTESVIDPDQPVSSGNDSRTDTRAERIRDLVEEHLGEKVGTQICTIDLSPLGHIPIPTSRLLQPPNESIDPVETTKVAALVKLVRELNKDRVPYASQILLEPAGSSASYDYLLTSRLVPFGSGHGVVTEPDLKAHLNTNNEYEISKYVPGPSTNNWAAPVESHRYYANQRSYRPSRIEQFDELSLLDGSTEELVTGLTEYRALMAGRVHNDERYEKLFNVHGRIPIHTNDLRHFFTVLPYYFEENPFGRLAVIDEPKISPGDIGSEIPATGQSYGTENIGDTTTVTDDSDEESPGHKALVSQRIEVLHRHGHEILAVDQDVINIDLPGKDPTTTQYLDGESRPDIVSKKDGIVYFHEIELENKSKPAALLTNLARADYHGHDVHVITKKEDEAESKLWTKNLDAKTGPVSKTFKGTDGEWTILYTYRDAVHQTATDGGDEVWYLLPREQSEATWVLTPDDMLKLIGNDGSILAEGHAETPANEFTYHTPRVRKDGSEWVLESASGEVLRRRPTKAAAASGYTFIRKAFVPPRYEFLEITTVEFQSGDLFTIFERPPSWEKPHQNDSIRYEDSIKEFIELVTVEREGAEIPIPELRQRFRPWYRTQTDLKEPNDTWFGRALRRIGYEVDDSDDHNKKLVDRTFRFSEGLLSPDLPFVDKTD